jgi:hypothetical protein
VAARLLNGEGEAGEVDSSCLTTSTQAAACPRSRSSVKKLVGEYMAASTCVAPACRAPETVNCMVSKIKLRTN